MSGRVVVWGAGVTTVLGSALGWLTNELDGGWPWWAATVVVTLVAAGLSMWLASVAGGGPMQVEAGAVYAGRDLGGRVRTRFRGPRPVGAGPTSDGRVGVGGVAAGRDMSADVATDVEIGGRPGGSLRSDGDAGGPR